MNATDSAQPAYRTRSRVATGAIVLVAALIAVVLVQELQRAASHSDEKLQIAGVVNFGRMNERLYRGAQPTTEGFAALKGLGIGTVVRLSLGEEGGAAEEKDVTSLGMRFVSFPWSTEHEPTRDQVIGFLSLFRDRPREKIFVHCKRGADRTGVMVALYRIAFDRWSVDQALDEMTAFHYHYLFLPHLQNYVEQFPSVFAVDPGYRSLDATDGDGF